MPKIMHISFSWDNKMLNRRHSDYILAMGWIRRGWDVYYYDYRLQGRLAGNQIMNEGIVENVIKHKPDILIFSKSIGGVHTVGGRKTTSKVDPKVIHRIRENGFKGKIIHWYLDQRADLYEPSVEIAKNCDWYFHCSSGWRLKEYYDAVQVPSSFVLAPYEPSFCRPLPYENRSIPLLWMGGDHRQSKFEPTRYEILKELIKKKILLNYYGCFGNPKVWCPQYNKMIGTAKMLLSLYAYDMPLYYSNRFVHCIGAGTACLSYDFTDRKKMIPDEAGIFFKNVTEAKRKYSYYIQHEKELKEIAKRGREEAQKYFTADKVVEDILYTLKNGHSNLPFGETHNPKGIKFEIEDDIQNTNGKIYTVDSYADITCINEFDFVDNDIKTSSSKPKIKPKRIKSKIKRKLSIPKNHPRLL